MPDTPLGTSLIAPLAAPLATPPRRSDDRDGDDLFADWRARALAHAQALAPALDSKVLDAIVAEPPHDASHGDIAINAAMALARPLRKPPKAIAQDLAARFAEEPEVARCSIAGPGFINLKLKPDYWRAEVRRVLVGGEAWGFANIGQGRGVNIEYVSANPTGPLHVGHMRGAVFGDALAGVLAALGWRVTREYYVNDAGAQMLALGRSALARWRASAAAAAGGTEGGSEALEYPGAYLIPVGEALFADHGAPPADEAKALAIAQARAGAMMLATIREDLEALGVCHDVFTHEQALADSGAIEAAIAPLEAQGLVGMALPEAPLGTDAAKNWKPQEQLTFFSTRYGDDRDRSLRKPDGAWTYLAGDVAYHRNKIERGFDRLIAVLGADHHGYAARLQAVTLALSDGSRSLETLTCRLVRLLRQGKPEVMSKRAGTFVAMRQVIDETSADAARFLMLTRRNDAALDYDLAEATRRARDNPVFYVQYAHARICSLARKAHALGMDASAAALAKASLAPLEAEEELAVIAATARFPRALARAGDHAEPHRVANALHDIAAAVHGFWALGGSNPEWRIVRPDAKGATLARLALMNAARIALANGLRVLGVTAPETMPDNDDSTDTDTA